MFHNIAAWLMQRENVPLTRSGSAADVAGDLRRERLGRVTSRRTAGLLLPTALEEVTGVTSALRPRSTLAVIPAGPGHAVQAVTVDGAPAPAVGVSGVTLRAQGRHAR